MVRSTKGPAEKSKPEKAEDNPADDATMARPKDIDDTTWAQIESMARSQRTTTAEVIKRAIVAQYGAAPVAGAYHSGSKTDPTLA